jgi:transcriptional regulator with XRE-family HTH domain
VKEMAKFNNIAKLSLEARIKSGLSQVEVAKAVGYRNGQFVSNVERGICSIPTKNLKKYCSTVKLNVNDAITAILNDYQETITEELGVNNVRN